MRKSLSLFLLLVCGIVCGLAPLALPQAAFAAERRVALVIGNASYKAPGLDIPNARNDAEDTAAALTALGFDVLLETDVDLAAASKAIQKFARMSIGADATLFYFAGHAVQFQGENYLLPVDAEVRDEISLPFETIAVDNIRAALDRSNGVKIMVLDACRTNPVSERLATLATAGAAASIDPGTRTRGIQRIDRSEGLIVAYSTSPGDVALDGQDRNSPFTKAFLRRLREPGVEIETMFRRIAADVSAATGGRQRPETYVSLVNEYYLNQDDRIAWDKVKGTDDPAALDDFLEHFPSSFYAIEARYRRAALERAIAEARAQALREADAVRREKEIAAQEAAAAQADAEKAACGRDEAALHSLAPQDREALRGLIATTGCGAVRTAAAASLAALDGQAAASAALCQREDADLKALAARGDAAGVEALRHTAQCPATIAAADEAACASATATLDAIGPRDAAALRALIDKAPCDAVKASAAARLGDADAAAAQEADACRRDEAAWQALLQGRSPPGAAARADIETLRQRASCPGVIAATDQALADLASACAHDQSALAAIAPNDSAALKAFAAGPLCDDARTAANARIASLEADARADAACRGEDAELAALRAQGAGARARLIDLKGRLACARLRPDVEAALEQLPAAASAPSPPAEAVAPERPQSPAGRLLRRPNKASIAPPEPKPAREKTARPAPQAPPEKPARVARPAPAERPQAPQAQSTAQAAPKPDHATASPLGVGF